MGKEIKVRIIMRYNSTEGWAAIENPKNAILAKGEIGLEYISGSSLPKMKIGNGASSWNNLPYFETSLPKNFTWGNLRGTTLQTSSTTTENLELTKPGFLDTVNIVTLNKNFDKIDNYYNLKSEEIKNLGERITNISNSLASTPSDYSALQLEVEAARTINGVTYDSLSNAFDALNNDLQTFKIQLEDIIGQSMPSQLIMEDNGMLYLADSEGNPIGEGTLVKDNALAAEVAGIRSRFGSAGTFDTAYAATQAIDEELQDIRIRANGDTSSRAGDSIRAIDYELNETKKELDRLKNEVIPDGLIYENNQLYLAVQNEPIGDPVEITGGSGGGGGTTSYVISLSNELDSRIISVAENVPVILKFSYTSIDADGMNDGQGSGELLIDNLKVTGFNVPQGSYELDVTQYLQKGTNNLKIKVTNSEGSYRSLTYTVNVLALSVESNFPTMGTYNQDSVAVQYTVSGEGSKTVYFVLTKQVYGAEPQILATETLTSSGQSRQITVNKPASSGSYILEIYATAGSGENIVTSNTVSIGMIWYSQTDTQPFILINTRQTKAVEGETISIPYLIFHPAYEVISAVFEVFKEEEIESFSKQTLTVDRTAKNWTIQNYPAGNTTFRITCGSITNSVTIFVEKSDFDKTIIQNGLLLEFNATGRQNTEDNPAHWEYGDIKATFDNVGWSSIDGWYIRPGEEQTVLRLLPGSSMNIPFKPFESNITSTGYTIEVELATQNVSDYDSIIMESFSGGRGLLIKSQSAQMNSTGSTISAQFKEDEKVRLTFVVEQFTANRLVTIYINGVSCGIQQYPQNDDFSHPNGLARGLTIGAESCGIDIYFIRFYKVAFSSTQQLNNFIVDRSTLAERIMKDKANAIINENAEALNKKITINSLKGSIPYIIMECPELPQFKGDKKKGMSFIFVDSKNPERSFTASNVQFDVQGTSSAGYPVKNFKLKLGKLDEGGGITYTQSGETAAGFRFKGENSLLTKVFCLKADYASSENANNVNLVDYYNQTCPYRNEAMQINNLVRWGVQGEPIVLFWRNTLTNEVYFQGKYNMNDDKDNENVFGFVDVLDEEKYPNIECWEFLNNNTELCLFSHQTDENNSAWFEKVTNDKGEEVIAWENSYERRFPEQDDDTVNKLSNFQRMINWVASTNRDRAFSSVALPTEVYYKTLDKSYAGSSKQYYEFKDNAYTPREVKQFDAVKVYDNKITVNAESFKTAILAAAPGLELYRGWICDPTDEGWKVFYYGEDDKEIVVLNKIENLESIGIKIGENFSGDNVVFEYYLGNDWNSALYEKHTHDTPDYRLAKFKNEFENYFVLQPVAYYYVFTETFLLMDSRAKNMFLMTFDGQHWFPSPYDMDTALGINNEGQLVFDYNLEDTDTSSGPMIYDGKNKLYDGSKTYIGTLNTTTNIFTSNNGEQVQYKGSIVFNGQESVLWNNFRDCFYSEIQTMYQGLRSQAGSENGKMEFSYPTISDKMNKHQDMWPEVVWNLDQEIKYLQPFYAGTNNLAMAQGDKRTQRNFWAFNTFKYRDSKYMTADSVNNYIHLRIYDKGTISITPYSHIYARVEFGNAKDEQKRAFRNETVEFNTDGIAAVSDLETHIFSSDRISKIGDLSPFYVGYCDFSMAPKLQEIIVGSDREGYLNGNLTTFTLGTSELLRLVDISNCYNLTDTIDASNCPTLKTFKAKGSAIAGVTFSVGGRLEEFYFPKTIKNLTLREQSHIKENGVNITPNDDGTYNLSTLWIDSTPNVPFFELMEQSKKLEYLRLINIDWHTNLTDLKRFYEIATVGHPLYDENGNLVNKTMGSVDASGAQVPGGGGVVTGKVYVESIEDEFLFQLNEAFPNLTVYVGIGDAAKPKFFIRYVTYDNQLLYSYIAEGGDTAIDPTTDESLSEDLRNEILSKIQSRPPLDSNGDQTIDTWFDYNGWTLPQDITQSYTLTPEYKIKYLVRFYSEEKAEQLGEDQFIYQGENAVDISKIENPIIPVKAPTAQFNYTFSKWDKSLINILAPIDYLPLFEQHTNIYEVHFYTNIDEPLSIQEVEYGAIAKDISQTEEIKYYIGGNTDRPSNLHEFKVWETKVSGIQGLTITPEFYQNEPIRFDATFTFTGSINDISWSQIAESAKNGTTSDYSVGSTKDIYITKNGVDYIVTMELVAINFDRLSKEVEGYNGDTNLAAYTFLVKEIKWLEQMNKDASFKTFIHPETGIEFSGPTAGGWSTSDLRAWSNNEEEGLFALLNREENEGLTEAIKEVNKISDIGMPDYPLPEGFSYALNNTNDKIWVPSTTELGAYYEQSPLSDEQSSQYYEYDGVKTYRSYEWFSNNQSRLKAFNNEYIGYFTRTQSQSLVYRFLIISNIGMATDETATTLLGYVFGFCI